MMEFDWEQQGCKRLHHLEDENADLKRENARLREYLKELELEVTPSCIVPQSFSTSYGDFNEPLKSRALLRRQFPD